MENGDRHSVGAVGAGEKGREVGEERRQMLGRTAGEGCGGWGGRGGVGIGKEEI